MHNRTPIAPVLLATLVVTLLACFSACAAEIYVAPSGSDANPGTIEQPIASPAHAQELIRKMTEGKKSSLPVTVFLRGGVYYLKEPLLFTARDSGSAQAPVCYQAYKGEQPVLSGGTRLTNLHWKPYKDGIMQTPVPADLKTDQLFVNNDRQIMARYPNIDPKQLHFQGSAADAISAERVAQWADPAGGYFHTMHPSLWGGFSYLITGKDPQGHLMLEGGWQNNRPGGATGKFIGEPRDIHKLYRMVENIFEELDTPGEWFLNTKTHTLYYYPPAGLDLDKAVIETPVLKQLVEFRGDRQAPVRFVKLKGLTFCHTLRTFMENKEKLLRTDWTVYRGGAIFLNGAEDCVLEDLRLDQLGGNAIFVNDYNRRITIKGSEIVRAGANGIAFVGDPKAARSALTGYEKRHKLSELDRKPGPLTENYPADCLVDDCLIHQTGCVEKQSAPIEIDLARNITVRHCSIYDVPRAGINIGDGCWGGHVIEWCDIFDTVRETGDHGSYNSWGRDRYWGLEECSDAEMKKVSLLDAIAPITLRFNRWRCDHGWDVDLDDGSSNYDIHDNLFLNGGLKFREGFHRIATNNILVNNTLHPHCWYPESGDIFRGNIVMAAYRPARMGAGKVNWGDSIDNNFFTSEADKTRFLTNGCDAHSLSGDPMFKDPTSGDYRVKEGSPALKVGFKNFPMDRFGVQKPELKAKTKTPLLPAQEGIALTDAASTASPDRLYHWMGAGIRNMKGMEYSALGIAENAPGIYLVEVPAGSEAETKGFKSGDFLQSIDEQIIPNTAGLTAALRKALATSPASGSRSLHLIRNQAPLTLSVHVSPSLPLPSAE